MGRFAQSVGEKGSKKWIQKLINDKPEILNKRIKRNLCLSNDDARALTYPTKHENNILLLNYGTNPILRTNVNK